MNYSSFASIACFPGLVFILLCRFRIKPLTVFKLCFKWCDSYLSHQVRSFVWFKELWDMRKGGSVYSVAELSGPVLSEAWVYLSMCCGTGSNTAVPPMLRAGSARTSSAPVGEHCPRWPSPEGSVCCSEEIYYSKQPLTSKGKEVIRNTSSRSVKDCFDSTLNYTPTLWLSDCGKLV